MQSIALPPATFDELMQEVDREDAVLLFQGRAGGYHNPLIVRVLRSDGSVWEAEDSRIPWNRDGHQLPDDEAALCIRRHNPEARDRDIAADEAEANARLIAAAPDLLAAAEALISHFGVVPGDHGCMYALRDAVAKARGEAVARG